jgi:hypothetical protein
MPTAEHQATLGIRCSGIESFSKVLNLVIEVKQVPEIGEPGNGYCKGKIIHRVISTNQVKSLSNLALLFNISVLSHIIIHPRSIIPSMLRPNEAP